MSDVKDDKVTRVQPLHDLGTRNQSRCRHDEKKMEEAHTPEDAVSFVERLFHEFRRDGFYR